MDHRLTIRVYYEDTDLAGVVYYANYLRFIERGRTEALRAAGVDQARLQATLGLVFVVRSLSIDYLAPARFDDLVEVRTRITRLRGASVEMAQEIWRGDACLTRAGVTCACMDAAGRPARMPPEVKQKLGQFAAAE
ncbi:MAG TPA: tol-pal system-associated acyl-CoA thioesterase [Thermohalobaculum sp.]|nr:tol-pal system-associated acyl-CoA thioesterase [Thermohalobaculum sp.]